MATFGEVMDEMANAEVALVEVRNALLYEESIAARGGGHVPQADIDAFNRTRSTLAQNLTRTLSQFQSMLDEASLPASVKERIRSYLGESDWGLMLLDRVPPIRMRDDGRLGALGALPLAAYPVAQGILLGVIAIASAAALIAVAVAFMDTAEAISDWAQSDIARSQGRIRALEIVCGMPGATPEDCRKAGTDFDKGNPKTPPPGLPGLGDVSNLLMWGAGLYLLYLAAPALKTAFAGEANRRYAR